jgi:toxin ParE1/3/4
VNVIATDSAEEDVLSAAVFYSEHSPDLPFAFLSELDRAYDLISENPEIGSPIGDGNRKVVLRRFPYFVIYRQEPDVCLVLAVAHQKRRPEYWK